MGMLSAVVEANGWVLAVTGDWPATAGAWSHNGEDRTEGQFLLDGVTQFALDADGTARLALSVRRQGFTRFEGRAVASTADIQTVVATKALRRPYPNQRLLDETDHGDGRRTIRLALSDRIYAGDSVMALSAAAGWKAGEAAATLSTVSNFSARPLPVAISRWAQPGFTLVRGTTRALVDVIVAAHHPRHFGPLLHQAIAALRLTATDGNSSRDYWFTEPQTSAQYGDGLRCWGGEIDLAGLNAGPVTIHRTEYPWIGAERSTGAGQSTDTTNGNPIGWANPLVLCYDPAGTLYPCRHVFVDAATGSTTPASVTVGVDLAAAKAGTAAADISTAVQALYLQNFALPARNGWAADAARAMDWNVITLAAGVQGWGATTVTSGANCNEGRLVVQGDPADASPRENCIWRTGATTISKQVARFWLQNLQVQGGEATLGGGLWHLDNVEVIGKPGFEAATTGIFSGTSANGYAILSATRLRWWKYGGALSGSNSRVSLIRNGEHSLGAQAIVHISSRKISDPLDQGRVANAFSTWGVSAFPNSDAMVWGCRAEDWAGRFTGADGARSGGSGTQASPNIYTRFAVVNSFCERSRGNSSERIWGIGESAYDQMQDCLFEGLTVVGNGWNAGYNDSPAPFANLEHTGNLIRNCVMGRHATKHDVFKGDGALTGGWEYLYGVGFAGNVHGNQIPATASNFQFAWFGLGSAVDTSYAGMGSNAFLQFVADKCDYGPEGLTANPTTGGPGGGDYRPAPGSPIRARGVAASVDRDLDNQVRRARFAAGGMEAEPQAGVPLAPDRAAHPQATTEARISLCASVRPAQGRHLVSGLWPMFRGQQLRVRRDGRSLWVDEDSRSLWVERD